MTTAIIGTGQIGGTVARELASGGETVVLSAGNTDNVKKLASEIGGQATAAPSNRNAVQGANTIVVALWLGPMRSVIEEVADLLPGKLVIDTSNPISIGADGNVSRTLPDGQAAGEVVSGWLPKGTRYAKAFGSLPAPLLASGARRTPTPAVLFYATDDAEASEEVERLIRIAGFDPVRVGGVGESLRIEVGGDLHAFGGLNVRLVDREEAASLVSKTKSPAEPG
jgi:8-hydroxy-5-deazaflavin:NADPH oxidoreductase